MVLLDTKHLLSYASKRIVLVQSQDIVCICSILHKSDQEAIRVSVNVASLTFPLRD